MNQARAINRFEYMAEVFPDIGILRKFSSEQACALWDFMCLAVFVDETCSDWEATAIQRIGLMMPNLPNDHNKVKPIKAYMGQDIRTQRKVMRELSKKIGDESAREATFKMLCVLSTIDELELEEIDFLDEAARALEIEPDMSEHFLRSSWETCRAHYYAA